MKAFIIQPNDAGQRLDRFIKKAVPALPDSLLQRSIRLKRIKLNKKGAKNAAMLAAGDLVEMYLNDEFFSSKENSPGFLLAGTELAIVYEDTNLLLLDKAPGLVVHEDSFGQPDTLINRVCRYLYEKGEYDPQNEQSFVPALCNRIDRNTGGIVIAAKNAPTLRVVNDLIKKRLIDKYYLCMIHGRMTPAQGTLKQFLLKDADENRVEVFDWPVPGAKTALTRYKTLRSDEKLSLLEVELLTGRTHQIRASFAHVGHPLLGDHKYGNSKSNLGTGHRFQALYAYRLVFNGESEAEHLAYLNRREFIIEVPFRNEIK